MIALSMAVHNRPLLLAKTIQSLATTLSLEETTLVITDDASTDPFVEKIIQNIHFMPTVVLKNPQNLKQTLTSMNGIDYCFSHFEVPCVINIDSDTLFNPHWINKLMEVFHLHRDQKIAAISAFNVDYKWHKALSDYDALTVRKSSLGGFGLLITREFWEQFSPAMRQIIHEHPTYCWDWMISNIATIKGYELLALKDSYVQHIGIEEGLHTTENLPDVANNFVGIDAALDVNSASYWTEKWKQNRWIGGPFSRKNLAYFEQALKKIARKKGTSRNIRIADIGGGTGDWLNLLNYFLGTHKNPEKEIVARGSYSYPSAEANSFFSDRAGQNAWLPVTSPPEWIEEYVLDISQSAVDFGKRHLGSVSFREADLNLPLPFPDQYFDAAFCFQTLEHVRNLSSVLSELLRVTRYKLWIGIPAGGAIGGEHNHVFSPLSFEHLLSKITNNRVVQTQYLAAPGSLSFSRMFSIIKNGDAFFKINYLNSTNPFPKDLLIEITMPVKTTP